MHRIWPVFLLEEQFKPGNVTFGTGFLMCPQALDLVSDGVSSSSSGISSSTTISSTGTATVSQVESSAATKTTTTSATPTGNSGARTRSASCMIYGVLFWSLGGLT